VAAKMDGAGVARWDATESGNVHRRTALPDEDGHAAPFFEQTALSRHNHVRDGGQLTRSVPTPRISSVAIYYSIDAKHSASQRGQHPPVLVRGC
jgi:hypothetical protein